MADQNDLIRSPIQNPNMPIQVGSGNMPAIQAQGQLGAQVQRTAQTSMKIMADQRDKDSIADNTAAHAKRKEHYAQTLIKNKKTSNPADVVKNWNEHLSYLEKLTDEDDADGVPVFRNSHSKKMWNDYLKGYRGTTNASAQLQADEMNTRIAGQRRELWRQQFITEGESEGWKENLWTAYYAPQMSEGKSEAELRLLYEKDKKQIKLKFQQDKESMVTIGVQDITSSLISKMSEIDQSPGYSSTEKHNEKKKMLDFAKNYSKNLIDTYKNDIRSNKDYSETEKRQLLSRANTMAAGLKTYHKAMLDAESSRIDKQQDIYALSLMSEAAETGQPIAPDRIISASAKNLIKDTVAKQLMDRYGSWKKDQRTAELTRHKKKISTETEAYEVQQMNKLTREASDSLDNKLRTWTPQQWLENGNKEILNLELHKGIDPGSRTIMKGLITSKMKENEGYKNSTLESYMTPINDYLKKEFDDESWKAIEAANAIRKEAERLYQEPGGMQKMQKFLHETSKQAEDDAADLEVKSKFKKSEPGIFSRQMNQTNARWRKYGKPAWDSVNDKFRELYNDAGMGETTPMDDGIKFLKWFDDNVNSQNMLGGVQENWQRFRNWQKKKNDAEAAGILQEFKGEGGKEIPLGANEIFFRDDAGEVWILDVVSGKAKRKVSNK